MKINIFLIIAIFFIRQSYAQQFISKAVIEYEVKSNIKKTLGNNTFAEMLKDNLPQFKTGYYTFTFAENKSLFKFDHWDPAVKMPDYLKKSDEENNWYFDHTNNKFIMRKNLSGTNLNVADSIPVLKWRLTNENRIIAGFNCRKAITVIYDSVYVLAFYTDEIMISGGPCSLNGLPGMILGVTIPRLYTSWIATKVIITGVDETAIKPATTKKYFTLQSLRKTIIERTKGWYGVGENANEIKQQKQRLEWLALF